MLVTLQQHNQLCSFPIPYKNVSTVRSTHYKLCAPKRCFLDLNNTVKIWLLQTCCIARQQQRDLTENIAGQITAMSSAELYGWIMACIKGKFGYIFVHIIKIRCEDKSQNSAWYNHWAIVSCNPDHGPVYWIWSVYTHQFENTDPEATVWPDHGLTVVRYYHLVVPGTFKVCTKSGIINYSKDTEGIPKISRFWKKILSFFWEKGSEVADSRKRIEILYL